MSTEDRCEVAIVDPVLANLAATANSEHAETFRLMSSAVVHAIACGEVLIAARQRVPMTGWAAWIAENLDFTQSVAAKYVRLAANKSKLDLAEHTTIYGALAHLSALGVPGSNPGSAKRLPLSEAEVAEARRLRDAGASQKELAKRFGCSPEMVMARIDPEWLVKEKQRTRERNRRVRAQRKALAEKERHDAVARVGGTPAHAYALLRKAALALDRALAESSDPEFVELMRRAVSFTHKAEDEVVFALKIDRRTDRRPLPKRLGAPQGVAPGPRKAAGS